MSKLYLKPIGLLLGAVALEAQRAGIALPLAGGWTSFTCLEVIEGTPGKTTRKVVPLRDLIASGETHIRAMLSQLTAPREPIAGISMTQPRIMGIVNVTPDSFSDGGDFETASTAVTHAFKLVEDGADFIDIGGESTRPGSTEVGEADELQRVCPVLTQLNGLMAPISIDTRKAAVMEAAVTCGANMINDVSALSHDPRAAAAAKHTACPVILMHAQGDPRTMQDAPTYDDVVLEVYDYLEARAQAAESAGIFRERLVIDPGIGFGKTLEHNLALLANLTLFQGMGFPVLLGASRKRIIGSITGKSDPKQRLPGSIGAALAAATQGVQILRVHDVAETREALDVWMASITGKASE